MRRPLIPLCAALCVASCGGDTTPGGDAGAGGTGSGTGGNTATAGSGGVSAQGGSGTAGSAGGSAEGVCPATAVTNGSPCTDPWSVGAGIFGPSVHCSWGDDIRPECRTRAVCQQGQWSFLPADARCGAPLLPEECPASPPAAGVACSDIEARCWYGDGTRCHCSPCEGGTAYPLCRTIDPPQWACIPTPAGCPYPAAQAGDACASPDLYCALDCELPIICQGGVWQWGQENCPICAAPDTLIATPQGERSIASLRVGDLVYSVEHEAIVVVPIVRTGSTRVTSHHVVRVVLNDGRVIEMSPGHPTANGRSFAELSKGSVFDERHTVASVQVVPYAHDRTYDILPGSETGTYFAAGALVGSTLGAH